MGPVYYNNDARTHTMSANNIDQHQLYNVSKLSILIIGLGFAVRVNITPDLLRDIYDQIDLTHSASMLGEALGTTFTGFALTLLFIGPLVDLIVMKRMLLLSAPGCIGEPSISHPSS
jgi:MFS family permease